MKTTRREFIAASAAALAAAQAWGQSPNERLGIGLIGCGNRGNAHLGDLINLREAHNLQVVALCDVWKKNLDAAQARVQKESGAAPKTFTRFEELLALPEVDAVVIATPDFAHSPMLIAAANAKKHAYCEKPMAVRLEDANGAVDAVEQHQIVCQMGTQYRSGGGHMAGAKLIQAGALGKMIKCHTTYNDCGPRWIRPFDEVKAEDVDWKQYLMYLPDQPFDPRKFRLWHLYKDCTVGLIGLLGVHPIDVAHWYTEDPLPLSAVGMGAKIAWTDREHLDTQECTLAYPKGHILQFSSRLGNANGGPQNVFFGTKGTFDTESWTLRGDGGGDEKIGTPLTVEPEKAPGHMENWLQCIREKNRKTRADVHAGYAHSIASIMGARACETGRRMIYNAQSRTITEG